jgi:hypothetical protein
MQYMRYITLHMGGSLAMKRTWFALVMVLLCSMLFAVVAYGGELAPGVMFHEDFEAGDAELPENWTVFTPGDMRRTTEVAVSGKYSFVINDTDNNAGVGIRSPLFPVVAGQDYQAATWAMVASGEGSQLYLEFWDKSGTNRLAAPWIAITGAGSGWQYIVNGATAPAGAAYASVIIYVGKVPVCKTYFDDIELIDVAAYSSK